MIQNLLSVLGGIILLIGLVSAGVIWLRSWINSKIGPVLKLLEDRTGIDLPDLGKFTQQAPAQQSTDNPRIEALKDAEALLSHFEANKNAAGQSAMQAVVQALFTKPQ